MGVANATLEASAAFEHRAAAGGVFSGGDAWVGTAGASGRAPVAVGVCSGVSQHVQQSELERDVLVAQRGVLRFEEGGVRLVSATREIGCSHI